MKTLPITPVYSEIASKYNKKIFTFPMAHKQHAEILYDDRSMSAFVVEKGKGLVFARGFAGAKSPVDFAASASLIFARLEKLGADMAELAIAFQESILRNVK